MCAQGHLTRLANVFVGFDATVNPVLSVKETLQNKMAEISMLDSDTAEKIEAATKVMDDLKLPMEEREVWLEAF
jgi:hypothetical protein